MIDIVTVNDEGNLMDASALAALVALKMTKFPKYEDGIIDYATKSETPLPLSKKDPIAVTVYKVGEHFIVDPTTEEEKVYDARVTSTVTSDLTICSLQKGGESPLSIDDISKMTKLAITIAGKLRQKLR